MAKRRTKKQKLRAAARRANIEVKPPKTVSKPVTVTAKKPVPAATVSVAATTPSKLFPLSDLKLSILLLGVMAAVQVGLLFVFRSTAFDEHLFELIRL